MKRCTRFKMVLTGSGIADFLAGMSPCLLNSQITSWPLGISYSSPESDFRFGAAIGVGSPHPVGSTRSPGSLLLPFAFFPVGFAEAWGGVKGARFMRGAANP
jgi:hypothetical protein